MLPAAESGAGAGAERRGPSALRWQAVLLETPLIAKGREKLSKESTNVPRLFSCNTSLFKSQSYRKNVGSGLDERNMGIL